MRRFVLVIALAAAALPFAADVGAKELPTVQISSPPAKLRPHMVWWATITYTVEGRPYEAQGWHPYVQVQKTNGTAARIFNARLTAKTGVFRARVVFPSSGSWSYDVGDAAGLHDGARGEVMLLSRHH
jgi:hypothetical protein